MRLEIDTTFFFTTTKQGIYWGVLSLIFFLLLLWNYSIFSVAIESLNGGGGTDFSRFYHATQSFWEGTGLYAPSITTQAQWNGIYGQHLWDLNPPHFHLIFLPLIFLSIEDAFLLWALFSLGALLASLRLFSREISLNITIIQSVIVLIGLLVFTGTGLLLRSAQISFLLLLPFTLAWINARHKNWGKVGTYLGLCACIKPFFLIFLPYLILKKYVTALRSFTVIFVGAFVLGTLTFGIESHKDWLLALASVNWYWAGSNASILGFLTRSLAESPAYSVATYAPTLIFPLWVIGSVLVGLVTILTSAADVSRTAIDRSFSFLLIAAFLISPLGWTYYYFFLFAPLSSLAMEWWQRSASVHHQENHWKNHARKLLLVSAVPGLMVPMYHVVSFQPNPLATVSIASIYFWSTLFIWFSLLCDWYLVNREWASSFACRTKSTDSTTASPLTETVQ